MKFLGTFLLVLLFVGCTPKPKAIDYGEDSCTFCKMNIVDTQHSAELVTNKGKVFMFDAIECMINFQNEKVDYQYSYQLVANYNSPKALIDATASYYLISENLASPMGANLTAFATIQDAQEMRKHKDGHVFNWQELLIHFQNNN